MDKETYDLRFAEHTCHFIVLDERLMAWALQHDYVVNQNVFRTPNRELYHQGSSNRIIGISYESDWLQEDVSADPKHSVGIGASHVMGGNRKITMRESILVHEPFSCIEANLIPLRDDCEQRLGEWFQAMEIMHGNYKVYKL